MHWFKNEVFRAFQRDAHDVGILYFSGVWRNFLFIEIFFDRVIGFAKVRPLFPTARQGCRVWSLVF
jgi:hypothetical protein